MKNRAKYRSKKIFFFNLIYQITIFTRLKETKMNSYQDEIHHGACTQSPALKNS